MAKTKPIGVRFDEELLNKVKAASLASSPQKALNLYEKSYVQLIEMKVEENNRPENKKRILEERNPEIVVKDLTNNPPKSNYVANNNPKIKHYDYSAMPSNLTYSGREAWKKKAREQQDKQ